MRSFLQLLVGLIFSAIVAEPQIAKAAEDTPCKVEHWRSYYHDVMESLVIEGVTTCENARVALMLFEGEKPDRKFLGVIKTRISLYSFKAVVQDIKPKPTHLSLRWVVEYSE